jgi:hypothetical protein
MATLNEIVLFSSVLGTLMILAGGFWCFLVPAVAGSLAPFLAFGFVMGTVIYGIINA